MTELKNFWGVGESWHNIKISGGWGRGKPMGFNFHTGLLSNKKGNAKVLCGKDFMEGPVPTFFAGIKA